MTNTLDWEAVKEAPTNVCANAKNAAKTVHLTRKIERLIADGAGLEAAVASLLPMSDPGTIHADMRQLTDGVDAVYDNMDEAVSEDWLVQHMNETMAPLDNPARAAYAANLLELAPAQSVDPAVKERIAQIREQDEITGADVGFIAGVVRDAFSEDAGILTRSTVAAMESVMHELPPEYVRELGDAGREKAVAYAAACYVMNQCGENPWSADHDIAQQQPYTVGVIAAANTESSRLMYRYYEGKIRLTVLKEKLKALYQNAVTFVTNHTALAIAIGLQVVIGLTMYCELAMLFMYALHIGPWISAIGAAVLSGVTMTKVLTTQRLEDLVNAAWDLAKKAWDACSRALRSLFSGNENTEDEAEIEVIDTAAWEQDEDEEMSEEAEAPSGEDNDDEEDEESEEDPV